MNFRIPVYVYQTKSGYAARPLFFSHPERADGNLNRLLTRLTREIVEHLERLGREERHDPLGHWAFCPTVTTHRTTVDIELRRRVARVKYLLVAFDHMDRRLAFAPAVPNLWFEVTRGEPLEVRAQAVYSEHWRNVERDADPDDEIKPETGSLSGKAWVQVLDIAANVPALVPKKAQPNFLMLGGGEPADGATELRRVGRCLDWLYPDELDRAVLREREAEELFRLLELSDRRPVLLVGPRSVGKTAVVHECVFRRMRERKPKDKQHFQTWLVSPQRLISGMSYVGQWEGRLLAILKHATKRDHVLYFDDLLGLFLAGQTSQSSLSAAVVLKPYLERRDVRILAEITPESLRVLQEKDRGFADLFHVIRVSQPTDADTLRILIDQQRRLEGKHQCSFGLDVLPAVIDQQRRYDRSAAFPGKAASVLTRLAVRATANTNEQPNDTPRDPYGLPPRPEITRDDVLTDFAARSGLSLAFLDPKQRLDRDDVRDQLARLVIGQSQAVEALADVVSVAKARLNDPERPLAAFLFLGPTGVGKTECAKAIARVLFGSAERGMRSAEPKTSEDKPVAGSSGSALRAPDSALSDDRLLRFDLNEYNQPGAAARLVGTFNQPEGLLTSAIRRQPFAVVLLDEIEKADPEVFDLLLQLLGEGRLTDSLGRTADFTSALVIMTSNLGVREAEGNLGFVPEADRSFAYLRAAEKFFRPEFFNRLDRVIPFQKLTRDEMARIARRLVGEVLAREGFAQRKCVLNVAPDALDRVIRAGYDPALGARAMKRAVERELTQPAAARLAALDVNDLTVVTVRAHGNALAVGVQAPDWAAKLPLDRRTALPIRERLSSAWDDLDRADAVLDALRPNTELTAKHVRPEHERYFDLKELADAIGNTLNDFENRLEDRKRTYMEASQPEASGRRARYRAMKAKSIPDDPVGHGQPLRSLAAAESMEAGLRELFEESEPLPGDQDLFEVENRLALLNLMASAPVDEGVVYLRVRGFPDGEPCPAAELLHGYYARAWADGLGLDVESLPAEPSRLGVRGLKLKGVHARALAQTESGTHLYLPRHGGPVPLRVDVLGAWPGDVPDPFAFGPILRVYAEGQPVADLRTGLVSPLPARADFPEVFRAFTLAALPR